MKAAPAHVSHQKDAVQSGKVFRKRAEQQDSFFVAENKSNAFFGATPFFSKAPASIQNKCAGCEETQVQRSPAEEQSDIQQKAGEEPEVQAKCETCQEEQVQRAPSEEQPEIQQKAAEEPEVQAKCENCEEEQVQRSEIDKDPTAHGVEEESQLPNVATKLESPTSESNTFNTNGSTETSASHPPLVQAILKVGQPDDPYEREADQMGEQVMRMPEKIFSAPINPASNNNGNIQRKEEEEMPDVQGKIIQRAPSLQRQANGSLHTTSGFASRLQSSTSGGASMSPHIQQGMESTFGTDFSSIRIHTDSNAVQLNKEIGAQAFTYQNNIFFNSGKYAPETSGGRSLLAHELTHTVQQGAAVSKKSDNTSQDIQRSASDQISQLWNATGGRAINYAGRQLGRGLEAVREAGGEVWQVMLEQVDRLAPGLIEFLRSDLITIIKDRIFNFIDTRLGGLLTRVQTQGIIDIFQSLFGNITDAAGNLVASSCRYIADAAQSLFELIRGIYGPQIRMMAAIFNRVRAVVADLWNDFGAPAIDAIRSFAGGVWDWITDKARWLWNLTEPVRNAIADAWNWIKRQFSIAWNSTASVFDWIKEKAIQAWNRVKEYIQPIIRPLQIIGGILLLISPVGPIIAIIYAAPRIWNFIRWIINNWGEEVLIRARTFLTNQLLPDIRAGIQELQRLFTSGINWLNNSLASLGTAIMDGLNSLGLVPILRAIRNAVNAALTGIRNAINWARNGLRLFLDKAINFLQRIWSAVQPYLTFLLKLAIVILNPFLLPIVIAAWVWRLIPDCYKPPVINFVLQLVIGAINALSAFKLFGEWWIQTKTILLQHLNEALEKSDDQKIRITNRIAKMISELDLEILSNQIEAARQVPDYIDLEIQEELLGIQSGQVLPFERIVVTGSTTQTNATPSSFSQTNATPRTPEFEVDQVGMLELEPNVERDILAAPNQEILLDNGVHDDSRTVRGIVGELTPEQASSATDQAVSPTNDQVGATYSELTQEEMTELQINEMIENSNQQNAGACEPQQQAGSGAEAVFDEESKIGPLTERQRGRYLRNQMWNGVKKWFRCNWHWALPAFILGIIAVVALEILTEGLVTVAFEILGAIFLGIAAVRAIYHFGLFLAKSLVGQIQQAARSLTKSIVILAIELIMALTFGLGETIASTRRGLTAAWNAVSRTSRAIGSGARRGLRATGQVARALVRGEVRQAGNILRQTGQVFWRRGRIVMSGLGRRFGRGYQRLRDLTRALYQRLRFRRFKIVRRGLMFQLWGEVNPWYLLANGTLVHSESAVPGGVRVGTRGRNISEASNLVRSISQYSELGLGNLGETFYRLMDSPYFRNNAQLQRVLINGLNRFGTFELRTAMATIEELTRRNVQGVEMLLRDLAGTGAKFQGASWVVNFLSRNEDWLHAVVALEQRSSQGGLRIIDVTLAGAGRIEFKNWEGFYRETFLRQIYRDLRSGENMFWVFSERIGSRTDLIRLIDEALADTQLIRQLGISREYLLANRDAIIALCHVFNRQGRAFVR